MMLMIIEAETHATRSPSGPSKSVWLGGAVGLAYFLKLHLHTQSAGSIEPDPDSDDKQSRRIWWSLVIMDRWHASSTSSPLLIPDGSVVVYPEDQTLLGEPLYQLARLSMILGHFAEAALVVPTDLTALIVPPIQLVGTLLRGELERWRESLPQTFFPPSNSPLVHLCYWNLRILMELRLPESEPQDLLAIAVQIVTQLTNNSNLISPLTYHSTALATLTLVELTSLESSKEEAEKSLQSLRQTRIAHSAWDEAIREMINRKQSPATTILESQHALTASQGLQRLADLATATEEGRDPVAADDSKKESEQIVPLRSPQRYQELREAIRNGYLSYILGGETNL
ncbi:putative transcriptional regulatory protein [Lachnellula suecica]|uniref:Putative transcriptional regulatory protein n=1 Tax=Lachnellula suecica TaxID=602035 RepID=A0A8T9CLP4_9HELO|nr:putative transcriptional regulatory protein [Lachnellula suecica]